MGLDLQARASPHFTWGELVATAHRDPEIVAAQEDPPLSIVSNLRDRLCPMLEKIRSMVTGPIILSSGYRSPPLNDAVRGAHNSQHMWGLAADFTVPGLHVVDLYEIVISIGLGELDQAIFEYGRWVHVSAAPPDRPARHDLLMIFEPARYLPWNPSDPRIPRMDIA